MKIILLGPPGAGKGTQAELICKELGIPHISTGDMLRAAVRRGDELGKAVKQYIDVGTFAPDELIIAAVKLEIAEPVCKNGFILDGFPRTPQQAKALEDAGVTLDYVVQINVPDEVIVKRLAGRWVHPESGRTYHLISHPPKVPGKDDVTGEPLQQRPDDNEATIRDRLSLYHAKTEPLIAYYQLKAQQQSGLKFIQVDGTQDEDEVCNEILQGMKVKSRL